MNINVNIIYAAIFVMGLLIGALLYIFCRATKICKNTVEMPEKMETNNIETNDSAFTGETNLENSDDFLEAKLKDKCYNTKGKKIALKFTGLLSKLDAIVELNVNDTIRLYDGDGEVLMTIQRDKPTSVLINGDVVYENVFASTRSINKASEILIRVSSSDVSFFQTLIGKIRNVGVKYISIDGESVVRRRIRVQKAIPFYNLEGLN